MSKKEQLFPYYRVRQNDLTYLQVKQKANKVKKQNNVFIFEKYIKCHFFHIMPLHLVALLCHCFFVSFAAMNWTFFSFAAMNWTGKHRAFI